MIKVVISNLSLIEPDTRPLSMCLTLYVFEVTRLVFLHVFVDIMSSYVHIETSIYIYIYIYIYSELFPRFAAALVGAPISKFYVCLGCAAALAAAPISGI